MDAVEVPRYFVCPISLQIMKDPVTAATGITYDRGSIERWLFIDCNTTCPVTNLPLPRDSELTPNHTLRRLIQAWCTVNASRGVDRIPTPRAPVDASRVLKLLQDLSVPQLETQTLRLLSTLASDSESNRRCMVQAGVAKRMATMIVALVKKNQIERVEEALGVLHVLRPSPEELKPHIEDNHDLVDALTRVLEPPTTTPVDGRSNVPRSHAILLFKSVFEVANQTMMERLRPEFFQAVISVLRARISPQTTKTALQVLLAACPLGTNRGKIAEAGAVAELVELELTAPDKRTSELVLGVLDHLCACAHGRAELVGHAAGLAMVAKKILRVSPAADDIAVRILLSVCKYSPKSDVLPEMLSVGAVAKLCLVLQADCASGVKDKARWVLKLHSEAWKNSPCISSYLITRYS
ncbi:hypothetical protein Taro_043923 [Colocasia esculenta]|uniref:U-box domain-containing protein n=1 Tax=Colocasia esculenta TaxID=4460 RepID=A0A843WHQ2_COLES|nr:hypothetical protein [Colocasia esculenta]